MNILFLLGGTGKRFTTYGYTDPKPFVHIDGECIIHKVINSFNFSKKDKIDIIYNSYLDQYSFIDKINFNINFKINFEKINFNSESPIDTLNYYIQKKYDLLKKRKSRDLLILDCDTYYTCDILAEIKKTNYSTTVVFEPKEKKNIYSYCKINNKFILDIAEKKIISNYANSGAYYFKDIDYLKKTLNAITSSKIAKNQKYISLIYKHMLKKNKKISFIKISEKYIHILGTPNQLINESLKKKNNKKIFCFDLDKTLVTPPIQNDYSLCKPIKKNINYLNFLKQNGHTIIIHTARRMLTHKGNKKKVIQDIGLITKKHLKKLNINYDKIIFGKPYADFYIDDKAINAYDNLKFKLGYYPEAIKTRTFNNVEIGEKFTIKKIKNKNIFLNEKNFYQKLPNFLQFLYPKVYKIKNNELKLETIQGKNFSELLLARMINKKDIKNLFHELKFMHSFKKKKIYFNLTQHFIERLAICKIDMKKYEFIKELLKQLKKYKKKDNKISEITHGDLNFGNIIKEDNSNLRFIDPKIKVAKKSIYFNKEYDYAKILQSLEGYHHIIAKKKEDLYLKKIKNFYISELKNHSVKISNIYLLTSMLFITLIPFHSSELKDVFIKKSQKVFNRYLNLISN